MENHEHHNHDEMDHSKMDHSKMKHKKEDHSKMNHKGGDHSGHNPGHGEHGQGQCRHHFQNATRPADDAHALGERPRQAAVVRHLHHCHRD